MEVDAVRVKLIEADHYVSVFLNQNWRNFCA
jgi:hypothetical protein